MVQASMTFPEKSRGVAARKTGIARTEQAGSPPLSGHKSELWHTQLIWVVPRSAPSSLNWGEGYFYLEGLIWRNMNRDWKN